MKAGVVSIGVQIKGRFSALVWKEGFKTNREADI